jgi:hypothetical protein
MQSVILSILWHHLLRHPHEQAFSHRFEDGFGHSSQFIRVLVRCALSTFILLPDCCQFLVKGYRNL